MSSKNAYSFGPFLLNRNRRISAAWWKRTACGVKARIWCEDEDYWVEVLDDVFSKFDSVGLLEGLDSVYVGDNVCYPDHLANYMKGTIVIDNMVRSPRRDEEVLKKLFVHDLSPEYALVHEMMHHAHMNIYGYKSGSNPPPADIYNDVSAAAHTDIYEAVAEIGSAIYFDIDIPDRWHDMYFGWMGPQEIYEI